jgi:cell division initiation protein
MDWNLEVPPLNPLDLRYKEFSRAMRGYSPEEVRNYLGELADKIGEILEENGRLRSELARLRKESTPDEAEADLRDAIRSAERLGENLRAQAEREAKVILEQAQLARAQTEHEGAETLARMRRELQALKQERELFVAQFRALLEGYLSFLNRFGGD